VALSPCHDVNLHPYKIKDAQDPDSVTVATTGLDLMDQVEFPCQRTPPTPLDQLTLSRREALPFHLFVFTCDLLSSLLLLREYKRRARQSRLCLQEDGFHNKNLNHLPPRLPGDFFFLRRKGAEWRRKGKRLRLENDEER